MSWSYGQVLMHLPVVVDQNRMKNVVAAAVFALLINFYGCSPSPERIMKQYEEYRAVSTDGNRSGIAVDASMLNNFFAAITYSNPVLSENLEYLDLIKDRFWVADAENPARHFKIRIGNIARNSTVNGVDQPTTYGHSVILADASEAGDALKYVLVGFNGINKNESEELATQPLFFIIDRSSRNARLLTEQPLLADDLAAADYTEAHFPVRTATLVGRNGKSYSIRIGDIKRDDQGFASAEFYSTNIEAEDWLVDGVLLKQRTATPFSTEIIARSGRHQATGYGVSQNGGLLRETYGTREMPETIEVFTETAKIVFDGKTREVQP